jgi:hypothetical protein
MEWGWGVLVAFVVLGAALWALQYRGPRVQPERIADEDLDLVRDGERARWRRVRVRTYESWKRHDDFFRVAAFRKHVAGGMPESEAKQRIRKDFPIYYLDPADRDAEGYAGDDGALPVVLRQRVDRNARILKELMDEGGGDFRTMNALVRVCLRKGAF